jgi:hypothetical protein
LANISSTADSKLTTKSQLKNSDITGGVKESTSDHLKSNTIKKVVNEVCTILHSYYVKRDLGGEQNLLYCDLATTVCCVL